MKKEKIMKERKKIMKLVDIVKEGNIEELKKVTDKALTNKINEKIKEKKNNVLEKFNKNKEGEEEKDETSD